jgi:ribosomal protein S18 acetylase RimI-like enzyme
MIVEHFTHDDIPLFLEFAAAEGWISSAWEIHFLLDAFPESCFSWREGDQAVAFVTTIKYDKSGWIGNLIVAETMRGRGIGSSLMRKAMEALLRAGAETVWLTASDLGKPIYERFGFVEIDAIKRWKGKGIGVHAEQARHISLEEAIKMDGQGWGEMRNSLVTAALERGEMFGTDGGFLVLQDCGAFRQAGPWGCDEAGDAALLLDTVLSRIEGAFEIVLDVPERNRAAASLLASRGFCVTGRTSLMYFGARPLYRPDKIYALGSMGSMG